MGVFSYNSLWTLVEGKETSESGTMGNAISASRGPKMELWLVPWPSDIQLKPPKGFVQIPSSTIRHKRSCQAFLNFQRLDQNEPSGAQSMHGY